MHPDTEALWLLIISTRPEYQACLPTIACSLWLFDQERDEPLLCVDKDGDVYALADRGDGWLIDSYDAQVVVDHGEVQPLTPIIETYLRRVEPRMERLP